MKEVNVEILKQAAKQLMFTMNEEEYVKLEQEFSLIMAQMDLIKEIKGVDEATPMIFPFPVITSKMRSDEIEMPLTVEEVLQNAPEVVGQEIKLPKVIG
ncbi:MAG: Asp-tRNA(Asn)/Glu-tRNA(Gln) amidotransferase subunit GatC [Bacilli bacterium]|jgi:aspartyl/glutamyl-tRNA(Asn/Gln) amidotransferase C subunit